ncbi:hypothetical protein FRC02_000362 [Tulasnella sp. 418]|nr:hypothetical protein FRC02_000362 [Tulasnella sp. 418]
MPPRSKTCHFHSTQPGGCRRGTACTFLHIGPPGSAAQTATTDSHQAPSNNATPPSPAAVRSNQGDLPPGACRAFWENGDCHRGEFDCRHRHLKRGDNTTFKAAQLSASRQEYLQPDGLSNAIGSSTDAFSALKQYCSPTEAHNHLTLFLRPDYTFRTPLNIYSFVAILLSANENHEGWDLSDGQLLLAKIAESGGTGLLRIATILNHDNVSIDAGRTPSVLSFQRGYIRLLMYFSSQFVIRSTLHHLVNSLYSLIDEHFENIAKVLNNCMPPLIQARSFAERSDPNGAILSGLEIFRSLLTVLFEYATRFKQAVSRQPMFAPLVQSLTEWLNTWADSVTPMYPSFNDSVTGLPVESRTFLIKQLRKSLYDLSQIVDRAEGATSRRVSKPVGASLALDDEALVNGLMLTYEGPGNLREGGPRHDNDFEEISKIRIAPTHAELVSTVEDFLPANVPGAPHHLPSTSMQRLLDIQFRLLREELM